MPVGAPSKAVGFAVDKAECFCLGTIDGNPARDAIRPPASDPVVCWTCQGPANPNYAKEAKLTGRSVKNGVAQGKPMDPLGCEIDFYGYNEVVGVPIPRFQVCLTGTRVRNAAGLFAALPMIAVGVGFGSVCGHYVYGLDWAASPEPFDAPRGTAAVARGMVVGWVGGFYLIIPIVYAVLGATRKKPKADKHFPLVAALLARRWSFDID